MQHIKTLLFTFAVSTSILLTGCVGGGMPAYRYSSMNSVQSVQSGRILQVTAVKVEADPNSGVRGAIAGAPLGYLATTLLRSHSVGTQIAGSVAAGVIGQQVASMIGESVGAQVMVKLDSGAVVSVTQQADPRSFKPGMRVYVDGGGRLIVASN